MVKRIIDTNFWDDALVVEKYTPEDKYFMLYLMTNPKTTSIGIYPFVKKQVAFDLGYSVDTVSFLLERFEKSYEKVVYDDEHKEIAVKNSLKFTISKGGKPVEDMIDRELKSVKSGKLIQATYTDMEEWWTISNREIDTSIKNRFEEELKKRNIIINTNDNTNANANANTDTYTDSCNVSSSDSPQSQKRHDDSIPYREIVDYLNEKTGSQYKHTTQSTKNGIKARYNEGFKLDDFKRVIDVKTSQWLYDTKMKQYLRPQTLFGTKFEAYLNEQPNIYQFEDSMKRDEKEPTPEEVAEFEKAREQFDKYKRTYAQNQS